MVSICFNRCYARKERCCSAGALTAGVVDGVVPSQNQLGDGHKGIALLGQLLQNGGQRLRGVKGRVMKEHDGPPAPPCWSPAVQSPGQKSPSSPGCHHRKPLQTIDKHNSLAIVYNAYPQRCLRRPAIHLARYIRNLVDFFQEIVECRFRPLLFLTFLFL